MTQRIFDIENEKDMTDLWDIVPENIIRIRKGYKSEDGYYFNFYDTKDTTGFYETLFLNINWHDKKEITRPIQEATEADIGKICYFWDGDGEDYSKQIGLLTVIKEEKCIFRYVLANSVCFAHCRRLTKQEIEELC